MTGYFPHFKRDLIWNYLSFACLVITGLLINIVIGRIYGPEALGTFNLLYAIFVISSQFAIMGLHYSSLKHVAEQPKAPAQIGYSALICGLITSTAFVLILFVFQDVLGWLFSSENISKGLPFLLPGIVFITLNKILLWTLNGQKRMVELAQGNMARAGLIILFLIILVCLQVPAFMLPFIFTLADGVLILFLGSRFFKEHGFLSSYLDINWIQKHLAFGWKALWGGVIIETNFRIDILMLGLLTNEHTTGLYSLSTMIAEGLYNLLFVLRTMINPALVGMMQSGDHQGIRILLKKISIYLYPAFTLLIVLIGVLYIQTLHFLGLDAFTSSFLPLMILLTGIALAGPFIPFYEIFMQAGKSGRYSQFMAYIIATNIILNACLIPLWGMIGAAIATAGALIMSVLYFHFLCDKYLNLRLFSVRL
jgi:O-antigen/teichoic acid export membrane protein